MLSFRKYLRLQTHTHTHTHRIWNTWNLLLYHCNNGCTNGASVLPHTYIPCLVKSLNIFVLTLNQSRLCLELRSSWTLRRVDFVTDNSKDRSAFIDDVNNKKVLHYDPSCRHSLLTCGRDAKFEQTWMFNIDAWLRVFHVKVFWFCYQCSVPGVKVRTLLTADIIVLVGSCCRLLNDR